MDLGVIGHSNEEEHLKTDYAVVGDSDALVDKSPHKWAWIYALVDSNRGLDGSEHINEGEDQTTDFELENYCDVSFDETPH